MSKYLKLFETTSDYETYISGSDVVLPNVSVAKDAPTTVYYKPIPPMNIITYEASAKLAETTRTYNSGIHTYAFSGKSGQLTITSHTFENGVGTIEFNGDVTSIGNNAFLTCTGLTSITIPNSVTSIGSSAFLGCSGLTSINIPSGVTSIGYGAFNWCTGLTSITIPNSVTSIGYETFDGCGGLTSVTIGSGVTSIGGNAFNRCYFTSSNFVNNSSLNEVAENYWGATIVDTDINGLLIKNNEVAKYRGTSNSVTIPDSVTSIGNDAFWRCSGLTSVTIPSGVTSIGYDAFSDCSGLTSITIGSGVTSIDISAFKGCTSLTSITCNATTAPTIRSNTFQNVKTGGTLTVPSGSTGYDTWMGTGNYYLGKYNWRKVEQ